MAWLRLPLRFGFCLQHLRYLAKIGLHIGCNLSQLRHGLHKIADSSLVGIQGSTAIDDALRQLISLFLVDIQIIQGERAHVGLQLGVLLLQQGSILSQQLGFLLAVQRTGFVGLHGDQSGKYIWSRVLLVGYLKAYSIYQIGTLDCSNGGEFRHRLVVNELVLVFGIFTLGLHNISGETQGFIDLSLIG